MLSKYLKSYTDIAPLIVFRILFGMLMFISIIRFWYHGWIEKLYIDPTFHFHYSGFNWVTVPGNYTYLLFILTAISSVCIALGYKYRLAIIVFFLSFTYIELMDKTTYLNHYYFISITSFLMIFMPAGKAFALDLVKSPNKAIQFIPKYFIHSLMLLIAIVYIYAGLAKLNPDWMFKAMPLAIWLPSKFDIPLLGSFMEYRWVHFAFSWVGMFYDVFIVFFLLNRKTRKVAFIFVVLFHVLTRILFPIGMFPYIMIAAALLYFPADFHNRLLKFISQKSLYFLNQLNTKIFYKEVEIWASAQKLIIATFLIVQLLLPWRYLLNQGNIFWNEMGYRFSWRVMLMEKAGYAQFTVKDGESGNMFVVDNSDFLTPFQEKQMSTQVDFMIEFADYLKDHFVKDGHQNIEIYVESYVALNGRRSQEYVINSVNLLKTDSAKNYNDIIAPLKNE